MDLSTIINWSGSLFFSFVGSFAGSYWASKRATRKAEKELSS